MDISTVLKYANMKRGRGGIITADRYFRSIEQCMDGGFCPVKLFGCASPEEWKIKLSEAESKLVYSNDEMLVTNGVDDSAELKEHIKAKGGALMQFDAVVTTTKRDRDLDILETKGATLDPKAPLLWQHVPMQPIGSLVGQLQKSDSKLSARFAIADTELGRDAVALIELGALRISHGFDPTDFEPLKDEGFRVKEFEIYEVSLVSIPSNTDAVITAFSREKLHSPLVKSWAEQLYNERTFQVNIPAELIGTKGTMDLVYVPSTDEPQEDTKTPVAACPCKTAQSQGEKDFYADMNHLKGSQEWMRAILSDKLRNHVAMGSEDYAWIVGTFKSHAIVCVYDHNTRSESCSLIKWKMENGEPVWNGEAKPVELSLTAKSLDTAPAKPELKDATEFVMSCVDVTQLEHLETVLNANLKEHADQQRAADVAAENEQLISLLA